MSNKQEERKRKIGIYKITNKKNSKAYIGQSENIEVRWKRHVQDSKNPNSVAYNRGICRALRLHGIENFNFEILEECGVNELDEKEIYWIAYYDTYRHGYNDTLGGNGSRRDPDKKILGIICDLESTNMTHAQIAEKWHTSKSTVDRINSGTIWYQKDREYPIQKYKQSRKIKHCKMCGVEITKKRTYCEKCNADRMAQNKKTCIKCGKPISRKTLRYCLGCYKEEQAKNIPSKEELLEKILRNPFTKVADMYNVSDNVVRKWCKKLELPYQKSEIQKLRDNLGIEEWNSNINNNGTKKQVVQYDLKNNVVECFSSIRKASQKFVLENQNKNLSTVENGISRCCNSKQKTAYGYIWKFAS